MASSMFRIPAALLAAAALACSDSVAPLEEDQAAILFWGRDTTLSIQLKRIGIGGQTEVVLAVPPGYRIDSLGPSPDGRTILYTRHTNLGGIRTIERLVDGIPSPLTAPGTPMAWSPDGSHILWRETSQFEQIVSDENGAVLDTLEDFWDAAWSADGYSFYVSHRVNGWYSEIGRLPLWSDSATSITSDSAEDYLPQPSPDGRLVAFVSERDNGGLFLVGTDGSNDVRPLLAGREFIWNVPVSWSPNSRLLAVKFRDEWGADPRDELIVVDTQGSIVARRRFPVNSVLTFAWAPTKNVLMFVARTDQGAGPYQAFLTRSDFSDLRQVTFEPQGIAGAAWVPR